MESKQKLYQLSLNEKEIESLCDYIMENPNEPNIVVNEILELNSLKWEAPEEEEIVEEDEVVSESEEFSPSQNF